jgi:hypothetical protein
MQYALSRRSRGTFSGMLSTSSSTWVQAASRFGSLPWSSARAPRAQKVRLTSWRSSPLQGRLTPRVSASHSSRASPRVRLRTGRQTEAACRASQEEGREKNARLGPAPRPLPQLIESEPVGGCAFCAGPPKARPQGSRCPSTRGPLPIHLRRTGTAEEPGNESAEGHRDWRGDPRFDHGREAHGRTCGGRRRVRVRARGRHRLLRPLRGDGPAHPRGPGRRARPRRRLRRPLLPAQGRTTTSSRMGR